MKLEHALAVVCVCLFTWVIWLLPQAIVKEQEMRAERNAKAYRFSEDINDWTYSIEHRYPIRKEK
jgi:hypothetical protein